MKSSEGHTLQGIYKSSVEGICPCCPQHREGIYTREQATFHAELERTKWLPGEAVTIPLSGPQFLPSIYCPYPEGGVLWVLGSFQGPLTCLWQLWKGQREVARVGEPPPSQAVQAQALGVEAVAGQLGQCQSPSLERWGQGPQQGWEWGQK